MALYMSTWRDASGSLPVEVGYMFSRMDTFNPLHRYQKMKSSIPSVEGQMWCGLDVNAGESPVYNFATGRYRPRVIQRQTDWPKTVPMLFMRAATALCGPAR